MAQVLLEAGHGILVGDGRQLLLGAVAQVVVGVGVRLEPRGVQLEQHRALARARPGDGLVHDGEDGDGVVAVDLLAHHAVADPLVGQRRCRGLLAERHRDRPPVVLHHEDRGDLEDGGEVEPLVEVALARGPVPDERHHDRVASPSLLAVRQPGRVQQLRRQRRALGRDVGLRDVIPAVLVTAEQGEHLDRVDPAADQGDAVAVGREDPVLLAQREDRADLAGLLAARAGIDGQAPLLGERRRLDVEAPPDHHPAVALDELVGVRLDVVVGHRLHPVALPVQEAHRLRGGDQPGLERLVPVRVVGMVDGLRGCAARDVVGCRHRQPPVCRGAG